MNRNYNLKKHSLTLPDKFQENIIIYEMRLRLEADNISYIKKLLLLYSVKNNI